MKKIDWKQKLSSRKLWAAFAGFATSIAALIGAGTETAERVTAIITAAGSVIAYIIAEGWTDAKREAQFTFTTGYAQIEDRFNEISQDEIVVTDERKD